MNNVFLASIMNHTYTIDLDSEEPSNYISSSEEESAKKEGTYGLYQAFL